MRTGSRPVNPGIDEFCRTLVHEAPDAIVYADVGGMIRFWNRGAERIFGFSASEVLGKSLDMIIPESMRKRHWDAYLETTRTGKTRYGAGEVLAVPGIAERQDVCADRIFYSPVSRSRWTHARSCRHSA